MSDIELIKTIAVFPKPIFSLLDLEKILGVAPSGLRTVVARLTKRGVLSKVCRGWYAPFGRITTAEEAAVQIYYPSYISLKTALSQAGWINQIPREIQLATPRKTYQTQIFGVNVNFHQIKEELFFGYYPENGIPTAYPEKALLDLIYFVSLNKEYLSVLELDVKRINLNRWHEFKQKFPPQKKFRRLILEIEKKFKKRA